MLKQNRIPADRRIKNPHVQKPLEPQKKNRNRQHRRPKNLNNAGGINSQNKKRQAEPGQSRRPHLVNRDYEIQSSKNGRKSNDKHAQSRGNHLRVCVRAAVGSIESPTGIHAARQNRILRQNRANNIEIPAKQINSRKRQIPSPHHQRHQKTPQHRRNRRNQEKENHPHAVNRKKLVISSRLHQRPGRLDQVQADQSSRRPANKKHESNRGQIKQRNALVVGGKQPRF